MARNNAHPADPVDAPHALFIGQKHPIVRRVFFDRVTYLSAEPAPAVLRVALDVPMRRLFDYLPPDVPVVPGQRVRVPFGRQRLVGLVVDHAATSELPLDRLKPVLEVLDVEPVLDASAVELLKWAADYYHHPIGEVLSTAMPKALREGAATVAVEQVWRITDAGREAATAGEPKRAPKQKQVLELFTQHTELTGGCTVFALRRMAGACPCFVEARLADIRGTSSPARVRAIVVPSHGNERREAPTGSRTRATHLRRRHLRRRWWKFETFVLYGVTGSGKTEVYLQVVERVLARGQRALVLVPEIGLTPQLVERFSARFDVPMAVLHSALTDTERLNAWRSAFSGHARIVLGTRSAVFAPVRDLGVIIVDEEHDASFKQHEGASGTPPATSRWCVPSRRACQSCSARRHQHWKHFTT